MPIDAPDWTLWTQLVEVVAGTPVPEQAGTEYAVAETEGKVATALTTYSTLASWTVTAARAGVLRAVEMAASDYDIAQFRLTIKGTQLFTNVDLPTSLSLLFAELRLEPGDVVLVEGRSSTGASVDLWGMIEGKEVA